MRDASSYRLGIGTGSPFFAGKDKLLNDAEKYLRAMKKGYPSKSIIYYGLKGSGKTDLLDTIKEMAEELGIICVPIETSENTLLLGQFISASEKMLHSKNQMEMLLDDLTEMLVMMGRAAQNANKSICFFIDEVQCVKSDEMEALVMALHRVNQLGLPIMIFGAGLPSALKVVGELKSYAERLFKYVAMK